MRILRLFDIEFSAITQATKLIKGFLSRSKAETNSEQIQQDRRINNCSKLIHLGVMTTIISIVVGLLWYRFSDYYQTLFFVVESEDNFFVVRFNLRPEETGDALREFNVLGIFLTLVYFTTTTLSTVGYGDLYPFSIAEKFLATIL